MSNQIEVFDTDDDIRNIYRDDLNVGLTINDPSIAESIKHLKNNQPVKMYQKSIPDTTRSKIVFSRKIGWLKTQSYGLVVERDHVTYQKGYIQLVNIFKEFLYFYKSYSQKIGDVQDNIYERTFSIINIDNIPDLMFYIRKIFTRDVTGWIRFKRLFMIIDGQIDPVIIDTVTAKYIKYLIQQSKIYVYNETPGNEYLDTIVDNETLHKVMNMLYYLPYSYLFFLYKIMDAQGEVPGYTSIHDKAIMLEGETQ